MVQDFTRSAEVYLGLISTSLKLGWNLQALNLLRQALQDAFRQGQEAASK